VAAAEGWRAFRGHWASLPYHDEIVAEIAIKAFAARRLNG
jgi:hypothetical protein